MNLQGVRTAERLERQTRAAATATTTQAGQGAGEFKGRYHRSFVFYEIYFFEIKDFEDACRIIILSKQLPLNNCVNTQYTVPSTKKTLVWNESPLLHSSVFLCPYSRCFRSAWFSQAFPRDL